LSERAETQIFFFMPRAEHVDAVGKFVGFVPTWAAAWSFFSIPRVDRVTDDCPGSWSRRWFFLSLSFPSRCANCWDRSRDDKVATAGLGSNKSGSWSSALCAGT